MITMKEALLAAAALAGLTSLMAPAPAVAQEKYLGEIFQVGYTFCPRGSALAAGQMLAISSNSALFSLFGTTYGGDGRTTFALPDLRGRVPVSVGEGPRTSNYRLGQRGGRESVTLTIGQLPSHSHRATMNANRSGFADTFDPEGNSLGGNPEETIYRSASPNTEMAGGSVTISNNGGSQAHENRMPYLVTRFCVATQGIYPSRN